MRVDTIGQFKVLKHIEENFVLDEISIFKVDKSSLKVVDRTYESLVFSWDGSQVACEGGRCNV